jgi:hypothetical protein
VASPSRRHHHKFAYTGTRARGPPGPHVCPYTGIIIMHRTTSASGQPDKSGSPLVDLRKDNLYALMHRRAESNPTGSNDEVQELVLTYGQPPQFHGYTPETSLRCLSTVRLPFSYTLLISVGFSYFSVDQSLRKAVHSARYTYPNGKATEHRRIAKAESPAPRDSAVLASVLPLDSFAIDYQH